MVSSLFRFATLAGRTCRSSIQMGYSGDGEIDTDKTISLSLLGELNHFI